MDNKWKLVLGAIIVFVILVSFSLLLPSIFESSDEKKVIISGYLNDSSDNQPIQDAVVSLNKMIGDTMLGPIYEPFKNATSNQDGYYEFVLEHDFIDELKTLEDFERSIRISVKAEKYLDEKQLFEDGRYKYDFSLIPTGVITVKSNVNNIYMGLIEDGKDYPGKYSRFLYDSGESDIIESDEVPIGIYYLVVSSIGCKSQRIEAINLTKHENKIINIDLEQIQTNISVNGSATLSYPGEKERFDLLIYKNDKLIGVVKTDIEGNFSISLDEIGGYEIRCDMSFRHHGFSGEEEFLIYYGENSIQIGINEWIV